jgi:hypothetical protein
MRKAGMMLWLALLAVAPALAQDLPDSPQCQQRCGAVLPRRIDNPRDVQVCLGRCQVLERQQASGGRPAGAAPRGPASPPVPPAPAAVPPEAEGPFGAVYLAPAPSANMGLSTQMADRNAAHRSAELQCIGTQGVPCRLALEFRDRCAAVAQGVVGRGMVLTDDPSTFQVMVATPGAGETQAVAEREAMAACRQRFRGTCRMARSTCG